MRDEIARSQPGSRHTTASLASGGDNDPGHGYSLGHDEDELFFPGGSAASTAHGSGPGSASPLSPLEQLERDPFLNPVPGSPVRPGSGDISPISDAEVFREPESTTAASQSSQVHTPPRPRHASPTPSWVANPKTPAGPKHDYLEGRSSRRHHT